MKSFSDPDALRFALGALRDARIALVPTMGCLHAGHLSLIHAARRLADVVVVSIYVNPLQFAPGEDLERYPRTLDQDLACCQSAGVDCVFHPETLYPAQGPMVTLRVGELAECLCGLHRPGHFDGVATVVNVLCNIVQPDLALFGEKDWQQLQIVRRMVADLRLPVEIVSVPIVREADGLAMSSRNRYLTDSQRARAVALYRAIERMRAACREGERDARRLRSIGLDVLQQAGLRVEYLEIREAHTLRSLDRVDEHARVFIAAHLGVTRLIDNGALFEE